MVHGTSEIADRSTLDPPSSQAIQPRFGQLTDHWPQPNLPGAPRTVMHRGRPEWLVRCTSSLPHDRDEREPQPWDWRRSAVAASVVCMQHHRRQLLRPFADDPSRLDTGRSRGDPGGQRVGCWKHIELVDSEARAKSSPRMTANASKWQAEIRIALASRPRVECARDQDPWHVFGT